MSRIASVFKKGPAYVAYFTAGDGGLDASFQSLMALVKGGVDILEVGVPFSDPVADGPTIQQAQQRALDQGTTLEDVLTLVQRLRHEIDLPIVLFSYFNPIFIADQKGDFFKRAKAAGVDACLIVDLPLEESEKYYKQCIDAGIDPIGLIAPSTPIDRVKQINQHARGMLYYVCRKGVTGVKNDLPDDFKKKLKEIKSVSTLPVAVGFGISNQEMAASVLNEADGFVVGSLFVKSAAQGADSSKLTRLAKSIDPR